MTTGFDKLVVMQLEKQKYFQILKSEGLSQALTALHRDTERVEYEAFEGRNGYDPALVEYLESVREFSRELWRTSLGPDYYEKRS